MINTSKLHRELIESGIPIESCNSDGVILFKPEATQAQKDLAATILLNHNPYDYIEERRKLYWPTGDQLDAIYEGFVRIRDSGLLTFDKATLDWMDSCAKVKTDVPKV